MKTLLLTLLLVAGCGSKNSSTPVAPFTPAPQVDAIRVSLDAYKNDIDSMVAFLWPEKIETDTQRAQIRTVIGTSRQLKPLKDDYLRTKRTLDARFTEADCDCALNGNCDDGDSEENLAVCEEIESALSTNTQKLAAFYDLVTVIKDTIRAAGGEWIATNLDYPLLPFSTMNTQTFELKLEALGEETEEEERRAIPYPVMTPAFRAQAGTSERFTWMFPRADKGGTWTIRVLLGSTDGESLVFQGDLFWDTQGVRRRGIIQWEQLRN